MGEERRGRRGERRGKEGRKGGDGGEREEYRRGVWRRRRWEESGKVAGVTR